MNNFNRDTVREIVFKAEKNYHQLAELAFVFVNEDIDFKFESSKASITVEYVDFKWLVTTLVNHKLKEVEFLANNTTYNYLGEEANE
ncbi:MAG: hypothetical protein ABS904_00710 [Solibacillus isronensis]